MEPVNIALESLRKAGLGAYASTDGCPCMSFALHDVHVDVHCRKSGSNTHHDGGATIRVYSHAMGLGESRDMLRAVGEEVARQLGEWIAFDPADDFNIVLDQPRE